MEKRCMYDMHYDLLTILYFRLNPKSKYYDPERVIQDCKRIYASNNVRGGIINLYFMSESEMFEELDITREEFMDVKGMFQQSIAYLEELKSMQVIPQDMDFIYSIEGCDYLKDASDLEALYNLGLRSILPVWNEKNKFGSGNRSSDGLTPLGEELVKKAIELGIIVDVSHVNKRTFYDILDVVESERRLHPDLVVAATHSNVRSLCDRERNLDDVQLRRLRDVGGYIGLFTNGNFLSLPAINRQLSYDGRANEYVKHLRYLLEVIKYPQDKIVVATDDMNFHPDASYHGLEAFPLPTIARDLHSTIQKSFGSDVAQAILVDNPQRMISKVRQRRR